MPTLTDPREISARLQRYAKTYAAGAFAAPTAKELAAHPEVVREWGETLAIVRTLRSPSTRRDWTGRSFILGAGSSILTHLAHPPGVPLAEEVWSYDYVQAYPEDVETREGARLHRRERIATRITAASEILALWGVAGEGHVEKPVDRVTFGVVGEISPGDLAEMRQEALGLTGWGDDYPFYSDGSWGALSLRGFYPEDLGRSVKPAEMDRRWKIDHAADLARPCIWTPLAERCPAMVSTVRRTFPGMTFERVRLMRVAREGKLAILRRHSDITDRSAGTGDGYIARFHIPLLTQRDITMSVWDLEGRQLQVHLSPGEVWYFDQRKPHAVENRHGAERIHLVVDVVCDPAVRAMIGG